MKWNLLNPIPTHLASFINDVTQIRVFSDPLTSVTSFMNGGLMTLRMKDFFLQFFLLFICVFNLKIFLLFYFCILFLHCFWSFKFRACLKLGAPLFQSCGKLRVGPRLPSRSFEKGCSPERQIPGDTNCFRLYRTYYSGDMNNRLV